MTVEMGWRAAFQRSARAIAGGLSLKVSRSATALGQPTRMSLSLIALVLASLGAPASLLAASAPSPLPTAALTITAPPVLCQGVCEVFDFDARPGESVVFDGTASSPGSTGAPIATWAWIIDGTGTPTITETPTLTQAFATDGTHTVTLYVTDTAGNVSSQVPLTLYIYPPSVAVITGNRSIPDTDKLSGETVTLDGTQSTFGDCSGISTSSASVSSRTATSAAAGATSAAVAQTSRNPSRRAAAQPACTGLTYSWTVNGTTLTDHSATPTVRLNDGENSVSLAIRDANQASPPASATFTVAAPPPNAVIAGGNRTIADTDGKPGEMVVFDGSGSTTATGASITSYLWSVNGTPIETATGAHPTLALNDGVNTVSLSVSDSRGQSSSATTVTVTVTAAQAPTAVIAGGNRTIADTDGKPGESVTMDGSGSTAAAGATISTYTWSVNGTVVSNGNTPRPTLALSDGTNTVSLVVTDNRGQSSAATSVTITVSAAQTLTVSIIGGNRTVADSDGLPDERVALVGTASGGGGAFPESAFGWTATATVQGQTLTVDSAQGTSRPTLRLRDGANTVTLTVTDPATGSTSRSSAIITVAGSKAEGIPAPLSSTPGLTGNQKSVAQAIERSCSDLTSRYVAGEAVGANGIDLLQQCRALINDHVGAVDVAGLQNALTALSGQQVTEMQRMGLAFSDSNFASLGDRLTELRRGQLGASAAGVHVQGGTVELPLADLASVLGKALGGGAGDAPSVSDLLRDRLGIFITANLRVGDRESSDRESGFDGRSHGVTVGVDYRFTDSFVAGGSIGYARAKSEFAAPDARLDSKSITASVYGSWYMGNGYLDFIASRGKIDYDSSRHILFTSSVVTATNGLVDRTATGSTNGHQTAVSASTGYDWHWRGMVAGPAISLNYIRVGIDGFDESGAEGLNLTFNDQTGESLTLKAGGHASYVLNTRFGVLMPHLQASGIHEFARTAQAVTGRFQADFASTFSILTDAPDRDYFNWSAGFSAQFPFGIAAFLDHQAMAGLARTSLHDTSVGLRIATHF